MIAIAVLNSLAQGDLVGVLAGGLLDRQKLSSIGLNEVHVLAADGLVVINVGSRLEVLDIVGPDYALHVQCVVQDLCSVLTRQSSVQVGVNVLEEVVQLAVLHGVLSPSCAGQASLLSIVASSYQYHLCSLETGYGIVRSKLGSRLTSDDAGVLQVTYVTLCPTCRCQIGKCSREGSVRVGIILAAVHDRKDHLCHLCAGNGFVRLERAVSVTLDYAQRREHVYSGVSLDVSLIAVRRRTGKHSERASERQYQCENLFEITTKIAVSIYRSVFLTFEAKSATFFPIEQHSKIPDYGFRSAILLCKLKKIYKQKYHQIIVSSNKKSITLIFKIPFSSYQRLRISCRTIIFGNESPVRENGLFSVIAFSSVPSAYAD